MKMFSGLGVKLSGTASTSDEEDDRDYLDITLETIKTTSEDEAAPSDYGQTVTITVSSIAGYTPKGEYEITVQKSSYGDEDEWENAEVLKFDTSKEESDYKSNAIRSSSSSGCNSGFTVVMFGLALLVLISKRKAL